MTFLRLGKLEPIDALFYVVSQFIDGAAGVFIMTFSLGSALADPHVNYLVTVPGHLGAGVAFAAEAIIPFGLMFVALAASNHVRMTRFTGLIVGVLVAAYIAFEAPLSGMSMNPARTMGSALSAWAWRGIWIYFAAPLLGMLLASELYVRCRGIQGVLCAKLNHYGHGRCIFHCSYPDSKMPLPERV